MGSRHLCIITGLCIALLNTSHKINHLMKDLVHTGRTMPYTSAAPHLSTEGPINGYWDTAAAWPQMLCPNKTSVWVLVLKFRQ